LADRSFGAVGPRIWNSLPRGLRALDISYKHFKTLLKTLYVSTKSRHFVTFYISALEILPLTYIDRCGCCDGRYTESCWLGVFDVGGAGGRVSLSARTCFDYRQVVAPRFIAERMSINEVTELSVSPSHADAVLINIGRRHLLIYTADDDRAVTADVGALRRW